MATLDLFASALGAFILISIIIFPLIADTPRSEPAEPVPLLAVAPPAAPPVAEPEPVTCPVCPAVPAPVPCPEPAPGPVPAASTYQLPHVDLVIARDVTSSMMRQVAALKAEVG